MVKIKYYHEVFKGPLTLLFSLYLMMNFSKCLLEIIYYCHMHST